MALTLETFPYFEYVVATLVGVWLWETYLNLRQRRKLHDKKPSKLLLEKELTDEKAYAKSQAYGLDKNSFTIFKEAVSLVESLIFIYIGYVWFWKSCGALVGDNMYYQSLAFIISHSVFEHVISAPFNLFSAFVVEEKHGFNKQTITIWCKDQLKTLAISVVLMCILLPIVLWIVDYFGDQFVLYLWITLSLFLLLFMWLAPEVIMPMFYSFESLDEEKHCTKERTKGLKAALDELAEGLKFPLRKIFVMDGSTRSSHSNAFQYGFCSNKRIVLFDTLLDQMSKEEIVSVMCHELGHWAHSHTIKGLVMTEVQIFLTFVLFRSVYANEYFYASFGFGGEGQPILIGLTLFMHLLGPVSVAMSFGHNYITRSWEYQADAFAAKFNHTEDLYNALVVLFKENKAKLDPDPLYEAYHHNHPSAVHRLNALLKLDKKGN